MFKVLALLFCSIVSTNQINLNYTDCGSGEIVYIKSESAVFEPYQIAPGGTIDLEVKFIPSYSAEAPKMELFTELFNFRLTLMTVDNFCGYYGLDCPLTRGKFAIFKVNQYISKYIPLPNFVGTFGFKLTNASNQTLVCASFKLGTTSHGFLQAHNEL